jgi:hypothetical protein
MLDKVKAWFKNLKAKKPPNYPVRDYSEAPLHDEEQGK